MTVTHHVYIRHHIRDARAYAETYISMAVVEIGPDEGKHLIEHLLEPGAMVQGDIVDRPEVIELWQILDTLKDTESWPADRAQQRRVLNHLKQRHDPSQEGGSIGRYKYLIEAFESLDSSSSSIGRTSEL